MVAYSVHALVNVNVEIIMNPHRYTCTWVYCIALSNSMYILYTSIILVIIVLEIMWPDTDGNEKFYFDNSFSLYDI